MASWQRYPGAWTPEDEASRRGGRTGACAPPIRFGENQEIKEDARMDLFAGRNGRAPPSHQFSAANTYPSQQEDTRPQFPGYPQMPPLGYGGYPTVQEPYDPMSYGHQWTRVQQSTEVRGQWVPLNGLQSHHGVWREESGAAQVNQQWGGPPGASSRTPGFLVATLRLCVFHVVNVFFSLVACGVLTAGICSAASMIPVCCVGLLIFQVVVYIGFALAQWDITLGNYIAPAHLCAYSNLLPPGRFVGREGYRISPSLAFFSPLSLMAMLYFVLVKPVIGALSFLSVVLVVAPTVSFITSLTAHSHADYDSIQIYGVGPMSLSRYPGLSLVGAICVTLVGVALMQLVAKISLGATRFFCCEKFAVTRQYQPLASNGVASYGTASANPWRINSQDC